MVNRTTEQAEETRIAVLAAARQQFGTKGFEASLSGIVEAAGVTKGALFHYFPSKVALFREVWTELQREMDAEARAASIAARSREDPYASFLAGCRTYLQWAARQDYQTIVLVDGPSVLGTAGWYEADFDLGQANVSAGLKYLASRGIIQRDRIGPLTVLLQNSLNGAGFALSRKTPGVNADNLFRAFESLLRNVR